MMDLTKTKMPEINISSKGQIYKIFEVTGNWGEVMPRHLSTKEAVVIVQEGKAILMINNENINLKKNDVYIIPASVIHSLLIIEKFKSIVIMENDSEIQFAAQ